MMKLEELVSQLKLAYGDGLRSVVLFGSAVAGEHNPKSSDYNVPRSRRRGQRMEIHRR